MPKKKKTEEKSLLKKKPRKKEKITSEEIKEKESIEEPLNVTIDLSEESPLEEIAEQPEVSETETTEFSEFMIPETSASDMPTLTLPSSSPSLAEPSENLESAASSIATSTSTTQPFQQDYVSIYNQPDYTAGTSEEKMIEGSRRSDRAVRTVEQLRDIRPRVEIEDWHETGESRERTRSGENLRDYMVTEVEKREETSKKLPFEERRKYRELKR